MLIISQIKLSETKKIINFIGKMYVIYKTRSKNELFKKKIAKKRDFI